MPTRDKFDTAYQVVDRNRAGSHEQRLMPPIVQRGLNEKISTFAGALPVRATSGKAGCISEQRAEGRRRRTTIAGRFLGPED